MTARPSRRDVLRSGGALAAGFAGLRLSLQSGRAGVLAPGYGPLLSDPRGVLDLPAGFSYTQFSSWGEEMTDGLRVPAGHDGMAAFAGPGRKTTLVRNHELDVILPIVGPFGFLNLRLTPDIREKLYDRGHGLFPALGGTTTLVFDTRTQQLEGHGLSLCGTTRNCAGGPTPWGTWLSCEESTQTQDLIYEKHHGYVFEVPALARRLVKARPIREMGRFNHEAVAVDPASGVVYLTEDRSDSLLYRYVPFAPGSLHQGGRLQALVVRDRLQLDTRNWNAQDVPPGQLLETRWIDLDDIQSPDDDLRLRGFEAGAARFARGEGMWAGADAVYFACTNGGANRTGQIWRYYPSPAEGAPDEDATPGVLELFLEPNDSALLVNADNLTVAPWGDLYVCEDSGGADRLMGVTQDGGIFEFGRNAFNDSEFSGATFSPDGTTLFVNIQIPGMTFAITGPWASRFMV